MVILERPYQRMIIRVLRGRQVLTRIHTLWTWARSHPVRVGRTLIRRVERQHPRTSWSHQVVPGMGLKVGIRIQRRLLGRIRIR